MYCDLTIKVTPKLIKEANQNEKMALIGHMGTHFDVMDKEFPLDYLHLPAIVFNVENIRNRDINIDDINLELVKENMFVAFYTGFLNEVGYGNSRYFKEHIQLSNQLINQLLEKNVAIIGIDCAGIRSGKEHRPIDQHCANHGTFVIENLCHLETLVKGEKLINCFINTYPVNYSDMTGLPCRVVAEM